MSLGRNFLRHLKLRTVLVVSLLLSGIIPLAISSVLIIQQSHGVLQNTERDNLTKEADTLSQEVNSHLASIRRQLSQFGTSILLTPGPAEAGDRLLSPWIGRQLQSFQKIDPDIQAIRVLGPDGAGLEPGNLAPEVRAAMDSAFEQARSGKAPAYRFVTLGPAKVPGAVLAVPIAVDAEGPKLIVEASLRFRPLEEVSKQVTQKESSQEVGVFLIDSQGKILWSTGATKETVPDPGLVQSFVERPLTQTSQTEVKAPGGKREVFTQVSHVPESGWGLVVQKPLAEAFADVNHMIVNAVLSTALLVALSLFFAYLAARWVSQPIQRLAETSHEIAEGNFGGKVEMTGLTFELADLAEDFNRMSGYVATHVLQLQQAARANRELFIGSLRAFAAAIDAKDPYTRGHSERVASLSRTISRYLQLPEEVQHKIWIGALLHDVGKIGIEDLILRKADGLTSEEYEQMKLHTVIGAEIMTPIEQLREVIPAIRWHHEAWNGSGYPDGLKGEQIPLFARVVAVADTFDALTTNRPYQRAYDLQAAVERITELTGRRFDAKIVTAFLRAFEAGEIRAGVQRPTRDTILVEAKAAGGQR
jgi:HD-GYP domain-containing protein (c-di-GMP phosphodiesterase class II)